MWKIMPDKCISSAQKFLNKVDFSSKILAQGLLLEFDWVIRKENRFHFEKPFFQYFNQNIQAKKGTI